MDPITHRLGKHGTISFSSYRTFLLMLVASPNERVVVGLANSRWVINYFHIFILHRPAIVFVYTAYWPGKLAEGYGMGI